MRRLLLATALLVPAIALAGEAPTADVASQIAELKQQIAELRKASGDLKVGLCNIVRIFDELEEKIDMNTKLRELEERREAELRDLLKRVNDLTEEIKVLRPDTADHKRKSQLLDEAKRSYRSRRDATEDQLYSKLFDFTHRIYKRIRSEIRDYAREAGYDLVLRVRDPEIGNFDQALRPRHKYLELQRRIENRGVLHYRPAHDFTESIIKRLNARYLREKAERDKARPKPDAGKGGAVGGNDK